MNKAENVAMLQMPVHFVRTQLAASPHLFHVLELQKLICYSKPEVSIVCKRQLQQLIKIALCLMHAVLGVRVCLQVCTANACFDLHHIVLRSSAILSLKSFARNPHCCEWSMAPSFLAVSACSCPACILVKLTSHIM